jgi:hypothetical protein
MPKWLVRVIFGIGVVLLLAAPCIYFLPSHGKVQAPVSVPPSLPDSMADGSAAHPVDERAKCPPGTEIFIENSESSNNGGAGFSMSANSHVCFIRTRAEGNKRGGYEVR